MKTSIKNRKKQLLALCLSVLMTSSIAAFTACNEDASNSSSSSTSSSSASTEEKTETLITNSNFKTFDKKDGLNLIGTTVFGWSRSNGSSASGSALSSKAASGIVDVSENAWSYLTESKKDTSSFSEADAEKEWDNLSAKDKLTYFERWKDENPKKKIAEELDFYEKFNVTLADLPTCENPGLREGATDNNVLMIHNDYPVWNSYKNIGTAQSFASSSTVTLPTGTAAEFSVWVKTSDLQCTTTGGEAQDAINKGAYIKVTQTVGGKSLPTLQVKNIQADEWTQYSFYLNGSSYADTTFTISLGLGQGGGDDKLEYVNGYAFFDDVECNLITREAYTEKTDDVKVTFDFDSTEEDKTINAYTTEDKKFALDFYGEFAPIEEFYQNLSVKATTQKGSSGNVYTAANGVEGATTYPGLGLDTANDVVKVLKTDDMKNSSNVYLKQVYEDYFKDDTFLAGSDMLMLMSANGAAYTANSNKTFTLKPDEYTVISFFVKTSELNGFTGAGITLKQGLYTIGLSAIDTTTADPVDIDDDTKDIYNGWKQCLFYVQNETAQDQTFTFTFNYGPTTVLDTTKANYYAGFAAFANFESRVLEKSEFQSATNGTYTSAVSLVNAEDLEASGDSGFDSASTSALENGLANPQNYKGVYSDSAYVSAGTDKTVNKNANAGLLNKKYADNYKELLTKLGGEEATWDSVFGNATQPLVIYNESTQEKAYGFIGAQKSIAADAADPTVISLRVKVSENAKAYVYLMDMDDDSHQNVLSVGRQVSYWYDDNGNVCAKDPASEDFNEKKDVAFKLQSNGLYKLNSNWEGAKDVANKDAYYANLANYAQDADKNLIVAENGVSYNYTNVWNNEGMDGIAFYHKDGKYYGDKACTDKNLVLDFSAANLAPRYSALEGKKGMSFEIGYTNEEWVTVSFFIKPGDTTKNYRLEVWSGSRYADMKIVNPADSYIFIDSNDPGALTADKFSTLLDARKKDVSEDKYFESVFSFYDSAKYLRYNETIDENGVGNAYDSYVSSSHEAGVAYLKYEGADGYEIYADYTLSEFTETADEVADDDSDSETEDDHDHDSEMNVWILISSIVIAVALLVAIVGLVLQKVIRARKKKNGTLTKDNAKKN